MTDLLLCYDFPPLGGGIARWMVELARRHQPGELVVSTGSLPGADDGSLPVEVDRLSVSSDRLRTLPGLWAWRRRVRQLVRSRGATFLWCGNLRPAGYVAARTRARDGVPYGILLHGGDLLQLRAKFRRSELKRRAARGILAGAERLVANSGWTGALAEEVAGELRLDVAGRLAVVPLGTDPARFRPGLDPGEVAARYRIPPGRQLLTVGRLVPHKGADVAIQALGEIRRRFPDVGLIVVGRGPERPALEALVRRLDLESAVRILDHVPDPDLPALYARATVYLGLSREEGLEVEGFGIALADAAGAGLPVVAGAGGGTADAVQEGTTGFRVPPRDPGAVAGAVAPLLADPAAAARIGAAGRRWAERYLNWDRVVTDLRALSRSAARSARR